MEYCSLQSYGFCYAVSQAKTRENYCTSRALLRSTVRSKLGDRKVKDRKNHSLLCLLANNARNSYRDEWWNQVTSGRTWSLLRLYHVRHVSIAI